MARETILMKSNLEDTVLRTRSQLLELDAAFFVRSGGQRSEHASRSASHWISRDDCLPIRGQLFASRRKLSLPITKVVFLRADERVSSFQITELGAVLTRANKSRVWDIYVCRQKYCSGPDPLGIFW